MFPLNTATFPVTADELCRRLNESLRNLFALTRDPVSLREKSYPHLESLTVCLDGAQLPKRPPPRPTVAGAREPALTIDSLAVNAFPMLVGPASVDFQLAAREVELHQAIDRDRQVLLLLHNAGKGRVEIAADVSDLESLIAEVAELEAGKRGVKIDRVELTIRSRDARSLAAASPSARR